MKENIKFLTAKQVSDYFQMPLRTVQHLSQQGKIKAFKIGGRWKYIKEEIEKYVAHSTDFSMEPTRKPNNYTERRVYPRINCSIPCSIKVSIPDEKEISSTGRISNISQNGVFIKNHENDNLFSQIMNDDPIILEFGLVQENLIILLCRVIRMDNRGIALKFKNVSENVRNIIANYVG